MNWKLLTPREIRDALRTAPTVLSAWHFREDVAPHRWVRSRTSDSATGLRDIGGQMASVRPALDGLWWDWSVDDRTQVRMREGIEKTPEAAKCAVDRILVSLGYVLDDEAHR